LFHIDVFQPHFPDTFVTNFNKFYEKKVIGKNKKSIFLIDTKEKRFIKIFDIKDKNSEIVNALLSPNLILCLLIKV
jgi:hypothetical protein